MTKWPGMVSSLPAQPGHQRRYSDQQNISNYPDHYEEQHCIIISIKVTAAFWCKTDENGEPFPPDMSQNNITHIPRKLIIFILSGKSSQLYPAK